eukprot:TRINITY_DN1431_c0_g2_i4.p2 TRINITY_DN1431_c0_g2~~TRINITY_DN1431_c0_g2_i4.p2  ORF type:complete len:151 (+),score=27.01 TRINITY_DN1431_c0_g2_i4:1216-1668(+)
MAPESIVKRKYSNQTDVWSFGVLAIEVLSQRYPFEDVDNTAFLVQLIKNELLPTTYIPAGTSEPLRSLVARCFELDPAARPTFATLQREFDVLHREACQPRSPPKPLPRPSVLVLPPAVAEAMRELEAADAARAAAKAAAATGAPRAEPR